MISIPRALIPYADAAIEIDALSAQLKMLGGDPAGVRQRAAEAAKSSPLLTGEYIAKALRREIWALLYPQR